MADSTNTLHIDHDQSVDISVPLDAAHAATLRVVVTSLAADADFTIDEIDDVKLAVSEVFTLLLDACGTDLDPPDGAEDDGPDTVGRAQAELVPGPGTLMICVHSDRVTAGIQLDALATTILSSVVDEFEVGATGITFVKRSVEASG